MANSAWKKKCQKIPEIFLWKVVIRSFSDPDVDGNQSSLISLEVMKWLFKYTYGILCMYT